MLCDLPFSTFRLLCCARPRDGDVAPVMVLTQPVANRLHSVPAPSAPPFAPIATPALAAGPGSPILQRYASRRFSQGYTSSGVESTHAYEVSERSLPVDYDDDLAGSAGQFEMDRRYGQNGYRNAISRAHDLTSDGQWLGITGSDGICGRLAASCMPGLLVNRGHLCHMPGHFASYSARNFDSVRTPQTRKPKTTWTGITAGTTVRTAGTTVKRRSRARWGCLRLPATRPRALHRHRAWAAPRLEGATPARQRR